MFGSSNRAGGSTGAMAYRSLKFEVGPIDELPADADDDNDVDGFDFLAWQRTLGSRSQLAADSNRDGVVNASDLGFWREQFGTTAPGNAQTKVGVPEPTSAALALVALSRLLRKPPRGDQ
jgi:hypothetical protein